MIDVGQVIGNYKITAKLGEGGMGVVYLAEHPVIGKKVAMKVIHPELSRNPEVVSRFVMEAKAANQIGHEHIVDIGDFGNTPSGDFYFIMEYLQGESLAERLTREVLMSQKRALAVAAQVADALGAAHDHGIIHRDLKPENIFLIARRGSPDFVKVLDFGLAKLVQAEEKVTHKTRAGSVMGTPYYMSPEQGEGKAQIDARADIYALGIILFEMLTGKVPFGGEGYGEIIVKHITHQPPSARKINSEISAAVETVLFRALAKDRVQRFQTMHEFREALLDPEGYLAGAPEGFSSQPEPTNPSPVAESMARSERNLHRRSVAPFRPAPPAPPKRIPETNSGSIGASLAKASRLVFVSYRRDDTKYESHAVASHLKARLGKEQVFHDIDSIPYGVDFREHIARYIDRCSVMLVVIGPRWRGDRLIRRARIMTEDDWVRIEIERAFQRKLRVIPLLLRGAPIPEKLPATLRRLAAAQAATIRDPPDFDSDIDRVIRSIERYWESL